MRGTGKVRQDGGLEGTRKWGLGLERVGGGEAERRGESKEESRREKGARSGAGGQQRG